MLQRLKSTDFDAELLPFLEVLHGTVKGFPDSSEHFRGQGDLVLVAVDAAALGAQLKWEPSRGGALFPHLYAPLDVAHARSVIPLKLGGDGVPVMPDLADDAGGAGNQEGA